MLSCFLLLAFIATQNCIDIFLLNSSKTNSLSSFANGNYSYPFHSLKDADDYTSNYYKNSSEIININLLVTSDNYNYFYYIKPETNSSNHTYSFFNDSNMKINIQGYFINCNECKSPSIMISDPYHIFLVNKILSFKHIDLIFKVKKNRTYIFIFNSMVYNNYFESYNVLIMNLKNIKYSSRISLFGSTELTSNISQIILNQTKIQNFYFKNGIVNIYTNIISFEMNIESIYIGNTLRNTDRYLFNFTGSPMNSLIIFKNWTIITSEFLLYANSGYRIIFENVNLTFINIYESFKPIFQLIENNHLIINNSTLKSFSKYQVLFLHALSKNSIVINNTKYRNFGYVELNNKNYLKLNLVNFTTSYEMIYGISKNQIILSNSTISMNAQNGTSNYLLYFIGRNLVIIDNINIYWQKEKYYDGDKTFFTLINGSYHLINISSILVLNGFFFRDLTNYYTSYYLDFYFKSNIQILGNCSLNLENCNETCSSPYYIDKKLDCSLCSDVINNCESCILQENYTTICLVYKTDVSDTSDLSVNFTKNESTTKKRRENNFSTILSVAASLIFIFIFVLISFRCLSYFYKITNKYKQDILFFLIFRRKEVNETIPRNLNIQPTVYSHSTNSSLYPENLTHINAININGGESLNLDENLKTNQKVDKQLSIGNGLDTNIFLPPPPIMKDFIINLAEEKENGLLGFEIFLKNQQNLTIYNLKNEPKELETINDLCIFEELGKGGSSQVLKVKKSEKFNKVYALKMFYNVADLNSQDTIDKVENLIQQIINLKKAQHIFFITFYGITYYIENNILSLGIVEELMDQDLNKFLQEKEEKLSRSDKLKISFNLVLVLHDFHKKGYIHQNLKLNNILINKKDLTIKFSNLGALMNLTNKNSEVNELTQKYLSPENLLHHYFHEETFRPNAKNDVWSLGLIFHKIFIGNFEENIPWLNYLGDKQKVKDIINEEEMRINRYCKDGKEGKHILDLINKFLQVKKSRRLKARNILNEFIGCRERIMMEM